MKDKLGQNGLANVLQSLYLRAGRLTVDAALKQALENICYLLGVYHSKREALTHPTVRKAGA